MKEILEFQKRLIKLTEYAIKNSDGHHKSSEPNITIGIDNEMNFWCEIYSYVLDFQDGGRHHYFEAISYEELIKLLDSAIHEEEKKWVVVK